MRELLPEAAGLPVTVHPRSNLRAVYVVGEWLLSRTLDIPEQYL